jgi:GTP cyclohydrolase I
MEQEKRFLVDVGMRDLPFPIRVASKVRPEGQFTVANISISARIMQDFQARWIDTFIRIVHAHRERIGTHTLRANILDYMKELDATMVKVDFDYPFFVEKTTPVSKEMCLVRYLCTYSAKALSLEGEPKILFKIGVPVLTTYPMSFPEEPGGLFAQMSIVSVEVESRETVFPEDLVDIVDRHALSPVYSYLTEEDQKFVIRKVHTESKTSVVMTDEIKSDLAKDRKITWYGVRCANFGMLHSYSTVIGTEKGMWVPFSGFDAGEI